MWHKLRGLIKISFWSLLIVAISVWYGWSRLEGLIGIPDHFRLIQGKEQIFQSKLPLEVGLSPGAERILRLQSGKELKLTPLKPGQSELDLSLFGVIPLRNRVVSVVPELKVVPGGESIGVMLASEGLLVAELAKVRTVDGTLFAPAAEAGILPGDILIQIDRFSIASPLDVQAALRNSQDVVTLKVRRRGEIRLIQVKPAKVMEGEKIEKRLGIYLEDTAAGVGTLSFYDPSSRSYAALGHMITDNRTGQEAEISDGQIVPAIIAGIQPGIRGQPGEKIGLFQDRIASLGAISKNCAIGIFGRLNRLPETKKEPLPIAMAHEVLEGSAQIYTVIEQDQVESFSVEVIRVNKQSQPGVKGMVIKVTDQRLLEITGGIVQGMSGSPIIQDGKLIGVVTHVFVNDPARGYGVFAEWMAYEAGMFVERPSEPAA